MTWAEMLAAFCSFFAACPAPPPPPPRVIPIGVECIERLPDGRWRIYYCPSARV